MRVFISHAAPDKPFARRLAEALINEGVSVWMDDFDLRVGDNIFDKIDRGLSESDYIVVILSPAFSESRWVQREVEAFIVREVNERRRSILPVLIADTEIPGFLQDRLYADFRGSFESGFQRLLGAILKKPSPELPTHDFPARVRERKESSIDLQISKIRQQYAAGKLSLFCGAGVSAAAGIPPWADLLQVLLAGLFRKQAPDDSSDDGMPRRLATLYRNYFNPSPLVVAQYLKNGLGAAFLPYIRKALYETSPTSSRLVDSIVDLCRPQRSRHSLQSILTFNFDDLIEQNLSRHHIKHVSIFKEGQRPQVTELPVYHVHGFLPSQGDLTNDHMIVFAEDAYHGQFMDSFSWSNLTQLNQLNQNLCLLVGLSMTDPNLRRLLDVSMRKNPDRVLNHYVFKKKYAPSALEQWVQARKLGQMSEQEAEEFVRTAQMLEEQDANNLGLNVIWIDGYDEIPDILSRIAAD